MHTDAGSRVRHSLLGFGSQETAQREYIALVAELAAKYSSS